MKKFFTFILALMASTYTLTAWAVSEEATLSATGKSGTSMLATLQAMQMLSATAKAGRWWMNVQTNPYLQPISRRSISTSTRQTEPPFTTSWGAV